MSLLSPRPIPLPPAVSNFPFERSPQPLGEQAQCFQFDEMFEHFHLVKQQARRNRLEQHYQVSRLPPGVNSAIVRWIMNRLTREHPRLFSLRTDGVRQTFSCRLTNQVLQFDSSQKLIGSDGPRLGPVYVDAVDALMSQVQEDLLILNPSPPAHFALAHLCYCHRLSAEDVVTQPPQQRWLDLQAIQTVPRVRTIAWLTGSDELNQLSPDVSEASIGVADLRARARIRVQREMFVALPAAPVQAIFMRTSLINWFDASRPQAPEARLRELFNAGVEDPEQIAGKLGRSVLRDPDAAD